MHLFVQSRVAIMMLGGVGAALPSLSVRTQGSTRTEANILAGTARVLRANSHPISGSTEGELTGDRVDLLREASVFAKFVALAEPHSADKRPLRLSSFPMPESRTWLHSCRSGAGRSYHQANE
jgi:hypothetical protein